MVRRDASHRKRLRKSPCRLHISCITLLTMAACAPGYSLTTVSETSSAIVLEYTASVNGELQAAVQTAEARCQQYGRHARMAASGPQRVSVDRAIVAFDCVSAP